MGTPKLGGVGGKRSKNGSSILGGKTEAHSEKMIGERGESALRQGRLDPHGIQRKGVGGGGQARGKKEGVADESFQGGKTEGSISTEGGGRGPSVGVRGGVTPDLVGEGRIPLRKGGGLEGTGTKCAHEFIRRKRFINAVETSKKKIAGSRRPGASGKRTKCFSQNSRSVGELH